MSAAIKTTEMVASFPSLTRPRSVAGGKEKFQITLVSTSDTDMDPIKASFVEAGKEFFGEKFGELLKKSSFKRALKKSDDDEDSRYAAGSYYISCYSPTKPDVVDRYADSDTGKPRRLTDSEIESKVYPGAKVRAVIRFYGYDNGGNKGVACAINAVQWLGDGPRLDNRVSAEDAFEAEEQDTADLPEPVEEEVVEKPKARKAERKSTKPSAGDLSDLL